MKITPTPRRGLLALALVGATAVALVGCSAPAPEPSGDPADEAMMTATLGTIPSGAFVLPFVADELGYFEEAGVDVEIQEVGGGMGAVLASDELDFGFFAGVLAPEVVAAGGDVVMVGSFVDGALMKLMGTPPVAEVEDLRGQTVVFGGASSISTLYFRAVLEQHDIDPDSDVQVQVIPSPTDQMSALLAGQIAGAVVSPPSNIIAEDQGSVELFDMDDLDDYQLPRAALMTRASFAADNSELTVRVIRGLMAAASDWDARADEIMEIMARIQGVEVDELIEAAHAEIAEALRLSPLVTSVEAETALQALIDAGVPGLESVDAGDTYVNNYAELAAG